MFIGFVKFGTYKDIFFLQKKLFKSKMIRINLEQIAINEFLANFHVYFYLTSDVWFIYYSSFKGLMFNHKPPVLIFRNSFGSIINGLSWVFGLTDTSKFLMIDARAALL